MSHTPSTTAEFFAKLTPVAHLTPAQRAEPLCRQPAFTDWLFTAQWPTWRAAARTLEGPSELEVARAAITRLCGVRCISELRDADQFVANVYEPYLAHWSAH